MYKFGKFMMEMKHLKALGKSKKKYMYYNCNVEG